MKNINIESLEKEIPADIRLKVYKEALFLCIGDLRTSKKVPSRVGLCILLPCLLWDIHWMSRSPSNNTWYLKEIPIAFPEITKNVIFDIEQSKEEDKQKLRIEYLTQIINNF